MQWKYRELEAIADRVLALPQTPKVGSSNQASPSGSMGVAVASTLKGLEVWVGVPSLRRNTLIEAKLVELRTYFSVAPLVGLRLPTAAEVFMHLYSISKQHGNFGWVQANCRKAKERGYFVSHMPSTQKSWRNMWCLAYGDWECSPGKTVTKHVPTHFQSIGSVKWGPISKEKEDKVKKVRLLLSEIEQEY
ncbi:unnamed protein product [Prunus brigantina]